MALRKTWKRIVSALLALMMAMPGTLACAPETVLAEDGTVQISIGVSDRGTAVLTGDGVAATSPILYTGETGTSAVLTVTPQAGYRSTGVLITYDSAYEILDDAGNVTDTLHFTKYAAYSAEYTADAALYAFTVPSEDCDIEVQYAGMADGYPVSYQTNYSSDDFPTSFYVAALSDGDTQTAPGENFSTAYAAGKVITVNVAGDADRLTGIKGVNAGDYSYSISVTDAEGNEIDTFTGTSGGTHSFTMPASAVTVVLTETYGNQGGGGSYVPDPFGDDTEPSAELAYYTQWADIEAGTAEVRLRGRLTPGKSGSPRLTSPQIVNIALDVSGSTLVTGSNRSDSTNCCNYDHFYEANIATFDAKSGYLEGESLSKVKDKVPDYVELYDSFHCRYFTLKDKSSGDYSRKNRLYYVKGSAVPVSDEDYLANPKFKNMAVAYDALMEDEIYTLKPSQAEYVRKVGRHRNQFGEGYKTHFPGEDDLVKGGNAGTGWSRNPSDETSPSVCITRLGISIGAVKDFVEYAHEQAKTIDDAHIYLNLSMWAKVYRYWPDSRWKDIATDEGYNAVMATLNGINPWKKQIPDPDGKELNTKTYFTKAADSIIGKDLLGALDADADVQDSGVALRDYINGSGGRITSIVLTDGQPVGDPGDYADKFNTVHSYGDTWGICIGMAKGSTGYTTMANVMPSDSSKTVSLMLNPQENFRNALIIAASEEDGGTGGIWARDVIRESQIDTEKFDITTIEGITSTKGSATVTESGKLVWNMGEVTKSEVVETTFRIKLKDKYRFLISDTSYHPLKTDTLKYTISGGKKDGEERSAALEPLNMVGDLVPSLSRISKDDAGNIINNGWFLRYGAVGFRADKNWTVPKSAPETYPVTLTRTPSFTDSAGKGSDISYTLSMSAMADGKYGVDMVLPQDTFSTMTGIGVSGTDGSRYSFRKQGEKYYPLLLYWYTYRDTFGTVNEAREYPAFTYDLAEGEDDSFVQIGKDVTSLLKGQTGLTVAYGFSFDNAPIGVDAVLTKTDAVTGERLHGAEFTIYEYYSATGKYKAYQDSDGEPVRIVESEKKDGTYHTTATLYYTKQNMGLFRAYETVVPEGYTAPWADYGNTSENVDLGLMKYYGISFNKDSASAGAQYVITNNSRGTFDNNAGYVRMTIIKSGDVYIADEGNDGVKETEKKPLAGAWYVVRSLKTMPGDSVVTAGTYIGDADTASDASIKEANTSVDINTLDLSWLDEEADCHVDFVDKTAPSLGGEYDIKPSVSADFVKGDDGKWAIRFDDGTKTSRVYVTDAEGKAAIPKLVDGVYEVMEVRAPEGYTRVPADSAVICDTRTLAFAHKEYPLPVLFENGQKGVDITPPEVEDPEQPPEHSASIRVTKHALKSVYDQGEKAVYSITVTNTGELTLHDVSVDDVLTPEGRDNVAAHIADIDTLLPGASRNFTYEYEVPLSAKGGDIIDNVATASGYAVDSDRDGLRLPVSDSDDERVTVRAGALSVTKTADRRHYKAGETVYYTVTVTNSSEYDRDDVRVDDFLPGIEFVDQGVKGISGGGGFVVIDTLPASSSVRLRYAYRIPDDFAAEDIDNIVVLKDYDNAPQTPGLSVIKEADHYVHKAGDKVRYTVSVTNTGDVVLRNVVLSDSLEGIEWEDGKNVISSLAPGASVTKNYTYVIPDGTAKGTVIDNTITARCSASYKGEDGRTHSEDLSDSDDASVAVTDGDVANIEIRKFAEKEYATNGETVGFAIRVRNTGNVDLHNVDVTDSLSGGVWLGEPRIGLLRAGESISLGYVYPVRGYSAGSIIDNTAAVKGRDENDNWVSDEDSDSITVRSYYEEEGSDEVTVPVTAPDITVYKNADKDAYAVGETVHYTIRVTNSGRCDLSDVLVKELMIGGQWKSSGYDVSNEGLMIPSLAVGETVTLMYDYVTKASDDGKAVINYTRATGYTDDGDPETPEDYVEAGDSDTVAVGKYIGVGKIGVLDGLEKFIGGAVISIYAAEDIRNLVTGDQVYAKDDLVYEAVTGDDGFITLPEPLPIGRYYALEKEPPAGFYRSSARIELEGTLYADHDDIATLYVGGWFRNPAARSVFFLRDDDTYNTLAQATFKITDENGKTVTFLDKDGVKQTSFRTDGSEDGYAVYGLNPGTAYSIVEVAPREGYVNRIVNASSSGNGHLTGKTGSSLMSFMIEDHAVQYDTAGKPVSVPEDFVVTLTNRIQTGTARVNKTGDVLSTWNIVNKVTTKAKKLFYSLFGWIIGNLEGATFRIVAREDIIHPDGKTGILFRKGDTVMEHVTSFQKEALETTDYSGYAVFEGLYLGKYSFVETAAPKGYSLLDAPVDFTIAYADSKAEVAYASGGDIRIYNERQHITVKVLKYDADNHKKKLKNAYFAIYNSAAITDYAGNTLVPKNTKLEQITSNSDGEYIFESDLPLGKYYVKEIKAPKGYKLDDRKVTVNATAGKDKYTFTCKFYDEKEKDEEEGKTPPTGGGGDDIVLVKTGPSTGAQGGYITYTLSQIANTTSHPVNDFTFEDDLASGTYLQVLNTGVYNSNVKMSVYYRLYGSTDWIRWKSDLSTATNSTLNVSELSGQISAYFNDGASVHTPYVTAFMLSYGTVPAGFAATTAPSYSVLVTSQVPVGTSIKNNASLTGNYGGKNYSKASSVTTLIPLGNGVLVGPVKTGDDSSLLLYGILALILGALAVLLGVDIYRRRRKALVRAKLAGKTLD